MAKKSKKEPQFRKMREELAGELTPSMTPGPITNAHVGRFRVVKPAGPEQIRVEDTGEK